MSVNGINHSLLNTIGTLRPNGANVDRATGQGVQRATTAPAALKPQAPIAGQATQASVPAEAPAGTDPALWSVLTAEERGHFAKASALGPLTYSRIKAVTNPAPPAARGVRLDVRA